LNSQKYDVAVSNGSVNRIASMANRVQLQLEADEAIQASQERLREVEKEDQTRRERLEAAMFEYGKIRLLYVQAWRGIFVSRKSGDIVKEAGAHGDSEASRQKMVTCLAAHAALFGSGFDAVAIVGRDCERAQQEAKAEYDRRVLNGQDQPRNVNGTWTQSQELVD